MTDDATILFGSRSAAGVVRSLPSLIATGLLGCASTGTVAANFLAEDIDPTQPLSVDRLMVQGGRRIQYAGGRTLSENVSTECGIVQNLGIGNDYRYQHVSMVATSGGSLRNLLQNVPTNGVRQD